VEWLKKLLHKYGNEHHMETFQKYCVKDKVYVAEAKKNLRGSFIQLSKFRRGRRSTFIIIPEG